MRYGFLSPFLQPQVLFTTNESQSYVFGGRNHPLHINSQLKMFFKQGWKLIIITILVMTGTFFGSLAVAQVVLQLTHAI